MSSELNRKFSSLRQVFEDLVIKKAALKWNTTVFYIFFTDDLEQFYGLESHGTIIILFQLNLNERGETELTGDLDELDIHDVGDQANTANSLRNYLSTLYLKVPFSKILRHNFSTATNATISSPRNHQASSNPRPDVRAAQIQSSEGQISLYCQSKDC